MAREKGDTQKKERLGRKMVGLVGAMNYCSWPGQPKVQGRLLLPAGLACAHPIPIWITPASTISLLARP